ncbi:MAG: hypothetical protein R3264_00695 [Anaerolineae bacterium]|nr:hypothetical protein [Anaerolineae bacterium]
MTTQFSAGITPPANPVGPALWFAFSGGTGWWTTTKLFFNMLTITAGCV